MKPRIKIAKAWANGCGFLFDEHHISNGHWIVYRAIVENERLFTEEGIAALGWPLERRHPLKDPLGICMELPPDFHSYLVTSELIDYRRERRPSYLRRIELQRPEGEEGDPVVTYVKEQYRLWLGIEPGDILRSPRANGLGIFVSEAGDRGLMPLWP